LVGGVVWNVVHFCLGGEKEVIDQIRE